MRTVYILRSIILCSVLLRWTSPVSYGQTAPLPKPSNAPGSNLAEFGKSDGVSFAENLGQVFGTDGLRRRDVLFAAYTGDVQLYLRTVGMSSVFARVERIADPDAVPDDAVHHDEDAVRTSLTLYRMDIDLIGANPDASVEAEDSREDLLNFYQTYCPNGVTSVRSFRTITYHDIYPHIDLVVHARGDGVKYDVVVRPGGKVSDFRMRYVGAETLTITSDGRLRATTPLGESVEDAPFTYQNLDAGRTVIGSRYRLQEDTVSFRIDAYDSSATLVIDPSRMWSTYYGGGLDEHILGGGAIALDASNNVYITGQTYSTNFPVTTGAYQTVNAGNRDGFLVKFNSSGVRQWATYFGGSAWELAHGVVVDGNGDVTVGGHTESTNFPVTSGAYQSSFAGTRDGFLIGFASGGTLRWATYYGSSALDDIYGLALDHAGNVIAVGNTKAAGTGLPTTSNAFQTIGGGNEDGFVVKVDSGGALNWATYYGGSSLDYAYAVATGSDDAIYFTGWTKSTNFPVTTGAYQTTCSSCPTYSDSYIVKLDSGGVRQWATFYGGGLSENYDGSGDGTSAIAVDHSDNVLIAGFTKSADLPVTTGAFQTSRGGTTTNQDAYVAKFGSGGARQWATYYGGGADDDAMGLAVDASNNVILTGGTLSTDFPLTANPYQGANAGMNDAYLVKLDSGGARQWATLYGGGDVDYGSEVVAQGSDYVYVTGLTKSRNFPISNGAQQTSCGGCSTYYDAFLAKFCLTVYNPIISADGPLVFCKGGNVTLTAPEGFDSYTWSNNATTRSITVTQTGNYTVTVTDAGGCGGTSDTLQVKVLVPPIVAAGPNLAICSGDSVRIGGRPTAAGGGGGFVYRWSPTTGLNSDAVANPMASPDVTTIYRLTVLDVNGCSGDAEVTVTVNPRPAVDAGDDRMICSGDRFPLGGTLLASGGTPPYRYLWTSPSDPSFASVTKAYPEVSPRETTIYFLTVTDARGCTATDSIRILVHQRPVADAGADVRICIGDSIALGGNDPVLGGAPPYTISWTPSTGLRSSLGSHPIARPMTTTRYLLTVVDAEGCADSSSVLVSVVGRPVADAGSDTTICFGSAVEIGGKQTALGGEGRYTYRWSPSVGLSSASVPNPIASPHESTTYRVIVSDSNGCGATDSVVVSVRPEFVADAGEDIDICQGFSTTIGGANPARGGEGPYTFVWSPSAGLSSAIARSPIASPNRTTSYVLSVTDAAGCTVTDTVLVRVNLSPVVDAGSDTAICSGEAVTLGGYPTVVGGTPPFSYSWYPSKGLSSATVANPVASPEQETRYIVMVVDAKGCRSIDSVQVMVHPSLRLDAGPDLDMCAGTGTTLGRHVAVSGGSGVYRYAWSPMTGLSDPFAADPEADPSITTTYRLTVTDGSNCSAVDSLTVLVHAPPQVTISPSAPAPICAGDSIELHAVGSFRAYLWSTGEVTRSIFVKKSGSYSLTVTDSNGCWATSPVVEVLVNPMPTVDVSGPPAVCTGSMSQYSVTAESDVVYEWSVSAGSQIVAGQGSNVVTVLWKYPGQGTVGVIGVARASGCRTVASSVAVEVGTSLVPVVVVHGSTILCRGDSVVLDAGAGYSSYRWSTGEQSRRITAGSSGSYSVTVTLAGSCSGTSKPVQVEVRSTMPPQPRIGATGASTLCRGDSLVLDAGPGVAYLWSTGETVRSIIVRSAGIYFVDVSNGEGCVGHSDTMVVKMSELPRPSIIVSGPTEFCRGGSVTLSATAGYVSYRWSNGQNGQRITVADSGEYWVEASGADGCVGESVPVAVTVHPLPSPSVVGPSSVCYDRIASYSLRRRTADLCVWSVTRGTILSGQGSDSIVVQWGYVGPGLVDVQQIDSSTGCDGSAPTLWVTIDSELRPAIHALSETLLCEGDSVVLEADPGYGSYLWSNGSLGERITVGAAGMYSVAVADEGGCVGTSNTIRVLTQPRPMPTVAVTGSSRFCAGDSLLLDAGSGYDGYLWSTGESTQRIVVRTSGSYQVSVMGGGCWGVSNPVAVMAIEPPPIGINTGNTKSLLPTSIELTDGDTITLSATDGFSQYIWSNGDTARTIAIDRPGEYQVVGIDTNGCSSVSVPFDLVMMDAASSVISLPQIEARPGQPLRIDLVMPEHRNLYRAKKIVGSSEQFGFEAEIRFDRSLLLPTGTTPMGRVEGNDRILSITGVMTDSTAPLASLEFLTALGDVQSTPLRIEHFRWKERAIKVTTVDGEVRINNICPEGGRRLFRDEGRLALKSARPNPAVAVTEIEYEIVEPGHTRLFVTDVLGNQVATLVDGEILPGAYSVRFDVTSLPTGSYVYVLQTPSQRLSRVMHIER